VSRLVWLRVRWWARKAYRYAMNNSDRIQTFTKWTVISAIPMVMLGFLAGSALSSKLGTLMIFLSILMIFVSIAGIILEDSLCSRRGPYQTLRREEAVKLAHACKGRMGRKNVEAWLDMPLIYDRKVALIIVGIPVSQALTWKVHRMTMEDLSVAAALAGVPTAV